MRVMVAAIGLASTVVVSVRASSSSTQENMKQKKAATPMPDAISGSEDLHEEARERIAVDIGGLVDLASARRDMKPSRIHTASGTLNRQCASATAMCVSIRPKAE